jgi:hypothetical protein
VRHNRSGRAPSYPPPPRKRRGLHTAQVWRKDKAVPSFFITSRFENHLPFVILVEYSKSMPHTHWKLFRTDKTTHASSSRFRRLLGAVGALAMLGGFVWWDQGSKPVRDAAEFGGAAQALLDASLDHAQAQLELTLTSARVLEHDPTLPGIDGSPGALDSQAGWASWSASIADLNRGADALRSAAADARHKSTTLKAAMPPQLQSELEQDRLDARSFLTALGGPTAETQPTLGDGGPVRSP